jgi:hypothetical protein
VLGHAARVEEPVPGGDGDDRGHLGQQRQLSGGHIAEEPVTGQGRPGDVGHVATSQITAATSLPASHATIRLS